VTALACVCVCVSQLTSQSNEAADETVRLMATKLMQSRSGSLVPMKSTTSASVKLSLTQQFHAAGIHLFVHLFLFLICFD